MAKSTTTCKAGGLRAAPHRGLRCCKSHHRKNPLRQSLTVTTTKGGGFCFSKITSINVLAVEGKDEKNFFTALLGFLKINNVQIIDIGGRDKFKFEFQALSIMDNFDTIKKIGFIRDAEEDNADSAFNSICSVLKRYSLPIPNSSSEIIDNNMRVGIFIMPNNEESGMLEDLCLKSIDNTDIEKCLIEYFTCVEMVNKNEFEKLNLAKARLLSYIAIKYPYTNSLGLAAMKNHFDFKHYCFDEIRSFLLKLFC